MDSDFTSFNLEGGKLTRRNFLNNAAYSMLTAGAVTAVASCKKGSNVIDVGSGDIGLLNIAFAFEQLELAFYTKIKSGFYLNATAAEQTLLNEILLHEQAHNYVLQSVIPQNGIFGLSFNFSQIDFADRSKVLAAAREIENTGVASYNGAAYQYKSIDYMAFTGKVVSVEARHAAVVNDLISFGNFIDSTYVDLSVSMERSITPAQAVAFINTYCLKKISVTKI